MALREALLFVVLVAVAAPAQPVRELVAAAGEITLDGRIEEAAWLRTPQTEPFLYLASATEPAARQTRGRLLCGREVLYVGLEADEPQMMALSAKVKPRDGDIWAEDALEVMLQPVPGSLRYYHFAFTPAGSRYDGMAGTAAAAQDWNAEPDWQVAIAKLADRWQAEVAIPWKALGVEAPLEGERWGLKLCRSIVGRGGSRQDDYHTSWSFQPSGSYHDAMGWGTLFFLSHNCIRNADFAPPPQPNGVPTGWTQQLSWQPDQPPAGVVAQVTLDGRNLLRLIKFPASKGDHLPRAMVTSLARGGRRFRATASVKAAGEVQLGLTLHAGAQASQVSTPFALTGQDFETIRATAEATAEGHAVTVMLSFAPGSVGEMLVRDVSLVDEGPPPQARPAIELNHGLAAACETLADMKPYDRLRDDQGRYRHERLIFRDQGTGTELWRITADWSAANAIYSNMFPWSPDGSAYRISTWERPGGPYLIAEADGDALRTLPELPLAQGLAWSRDPDWLVYGTFEVLMQLNWRSGETKELFRIPKEIRQGGRSTFSWNLDLPGIVYYEQAFGTKAPLFFIDLKTGQYTRLPITSDSTGDREKDWLYSAGLSRHRDGTWWVQYSLNHLPHLSEQNPYQQRVASLDGKVGMDRLTLDQPQGKPPQPLYSHGGTQPAQRFETGYSGGGICLWDFDAWAGRMLVPGPQDGHISWEYHDDWFFAGTHGRPLTGAFSSVLLKVCTDGTWYHVAYGNTSNTEYNTCFFANLSPDGTKGSFSSTMLGPVDLFWCVISYPEPPRNLRATLQDGKAVLTWEPAQKNRETAGYNVYRSDRSGVGFARLNERPVVATQYEDAAPGKTAFYVVTAVERSGIEGRCPSAEVALGAVGEEPERLFLEAERGKLQAPVRENLHGSASNLLCVDYRDGSGKGQATFEFACRRRGPHRLWGRIRYLGAGTPAEPWAISVNGVPVGRLTTTSREWEWSRLADLETEPARPLQITVAAANPGFALDRLLLTDDGGYTPQGEEKLDAQPPATPAGLRLSEARCFDVTLDWEPAAETAHYQVYRGSLADFATGQASLVASPGQPRYVDWGLRQGTPYWYRVTAVDSFGNESAPTPAVTVTTAALPQVVDLVIEAEAGQVPPGDEVVADPDAAGGRYVSLQPATADGKEVFAKLRVEFAAPVAGDYIVWLKACPVSDRGYAYASVEMDGGPYSSFLVYFPERKGSKRFADNCRWRYANAMRRELPVRFALAAGRHVLEVGSEPHHQSFGLDQIVISNDLGKRPPGRHLPWE